MKLKLFDFYVRGRGDFPFDMLRHDQCWPVSGEDAAKLSPNMTAANFLELRTVHLRSIQAPTTLRWSSFMWPAATQDVWS